MPLSFSLLRYRLIALPLLLSACASRPGLPTQFDLGPLPALHAVQTAPEAGRTKRLPLKVSEIVVPAMLDSNLMFYRLSYANSQQPKPYAASRWSMPPGQMLMQRLKAQLAQQGIPILQAQDQLNHAGVLRIELDEFIQDFKDAKQSQGQLRWRVSLIQGRNLFAQKSFQYSVPASKADAQAGAQALAQASDAAIAELLVWLQQLPGMQ